ncbi:MAG: fasciclin domain-containing protein, partial [Okeania sp. SIO4D6]|nr:fasciclin domain-containing protein [Okeania sp. SIO4D6]
LKILTYHVVPGKVMSGDLESGMVKTVEGSKVNIDVSNSGVKVGKANVVKADVPASNGVIHVIDTVIVPE